MNLEKIYNVCNGAKIGVFINMATKFNTGKSEFKIRQTTAMYNEICFKKHILRLKMIEHEIISKTIFQNVIKIEKMPYCSFEIE